MSGGAGALLGIVVAAGVALGWRYLVARVSAAAGAATSKALADYEHSNDQRLEEYKAIEGRRSKEMGLYARQRHRAYPRIYRRYRVAADMWSTAMMWPDGFESSGFLGAKHDALHALRKAKNTEILEDLYLSDGIRDHLNEVRQKIAGFSAEVTTQRRGDTGGLDRMLAKQATMEAAVIEMRNAMRDELRAGADGDRLYGE